ncbi:MAG: segregation/condensation protein A, partial [Anaerolineae bacterium]|nr:segregation/condensation protein A [Anaerolineae bacterium]
MDLLLFLIEKEELDITALALAKVTDEFLAYVETMRGRLEMEIVADFLVIAARLLWLKSLVLLPRPPQSVEAEGDDIEDELVQQLRAYRQYKESAQWFRERDEAGLRTYVHIPPTFHAQRVFLDLTGVTVEKLHAAAKTVFYPNEGL